MSLPRGFTIRSTHAARHGVTRYRLRGADVAHPFREISAIGVDLESLVELCRAYVLVMEAGQVFSHTTALALWGVPLPALPATLHISVLFPRTPPRRPRVEGHALRENPEVRLHGWPVAPPLTAWAQSAAVLGREDLTAAGDRLVLADRTGRSRARREELVTLADSWKGRPGAERLRWASEQVREGVRSRPETLLRLLLIRSGLPEPVVEHPVVVAGGLVLHPDLAYPEARLAIEYEGDDHRSRRQWEDDIERRELLADAGWRTVRVTGRQLFLRPGDVVARVTRHLSR